MRTVLDDGAIKPSRAHKDDAGLDLYTPIEVEIPSGGSAVIDTGVHIQLPKGTYGRIEGKSGLHIKHDIVCHGGTIDCGYTGSIAVKLYNHGDAAYKFNAGDKIAQLVVIPYRAVQIEVTDCLDKTERGSNGFGSSGR